MNKNLLAKIVLASSLVAVSAMAEGGFVGVEAGYSFKSKLSDADDKTPSFGIKGGYDYGLYRIYGQYNYNTEAKDSYSNSTSVSKLEWRSHEFLVGADFTPQINNDFRFLIGAYTGVSVIDWDLNAKSGTRTLIASKTQAGYILGAKIGAIYDINENSEIEFGLKTDKSWYSDSDIVDDYKQTKYGAYVGYSYKF